LNDLFIQYEAASAVKPAGGTDLRASGLGCPPLSAELGHCMRDLGRASDAVQHAGNALGSTGQFARSDFFVSLVLADAHLAAGDVEQACTVVLRALTDGEQIRSARCVSYLRAFIARLPPEGSRGLAGFREQAGESRLWRIASRPEKPVAS
jgi:hypothetical protein